MLHPCLRFSSWKENTGIQARTLPFSRNMLPAIRLFRQKYVSSCYVIQELPVLVLASVFLFLACDRMFWSRSTI
jgi:hypothetical protein